ncbi:AAA family ATPase [Streptomyces sp. MST-110588]|uniref:nucleotide-binding protein n=1 Tax=Streptomyces sp. MST-110588 TaxID=2833628 RepID=UPI001F5C679F|nr:AAA family ATPase [Streptomyces sp. MST-110588]UNO40174.1 AAA family ATPase [Streptomyces sp. MST-110588]
MTIRILPAVGDPDAARAVYSLLSQLPDAEPGAPVTDSTSLLNTLAQAAGAGRPPAEASLIQPSAAPPPVSSPAAGPGVPGPAAPSGAFLPAVPSRPPVGSVQELPEVVLVHERIGPVPALELIREVALRFPAVGVVLITADTGPALFSAAMDAGARGIVALPVGYEELAARVRAAAQWATGVRAHLGGATEAFSGPSGTLVTVTGAKGGVGATVTAVQLALAARAAGRAVALVDMDLQSGDIASYLDVQFRRSIVDLAGIQDISPRVLQDAVHAHHTGLGLLLAPEEGERGEEIDDRAARQILAALRARYEVVVVDCGAQMQSANAAAVELADVALLVTTPDVVCVRAAKRLVRLWDRLRIRKAQDTTTVVNRLTRNTEIQPPLVEKATGTKVARTPVPAGFKELQPCVDAGRMQDLDGRSAVRQALWALAGELGLIEAPAARQGRGSHRARTPLTGRRRKALTAGQPGTEGAGGPGGVASGGAPGQLGFSRPYGEG